MAAALDVGRMLMLTKGVFVATRWDAAKRSAMSMQVHYLGGGQGYIVEATVSPQPNAQSEISIYIRRTVGGLVASMVSVGVVVWLGAVSLMGPEIHVLDSIVAIGIGLVMLWSAYAGAKHADRVARHLVDRIVTGLESVSSEGSAHGVDGLEA
jgi:hypothetical protein